jgi:uncharacterized protein (DUF1778 family)
LAQEIDVESRRVRVEIRGKTSDYSAMIQQAADHMTFFQRLTTFML